MDQIKIGKFIAECRKKAGLTQMQLAERLAITDRAVSKWETGRTMPDSSIMLELCDVLKISVNDLLCGEIVGMDNYDKKLEEKLVKIIKEKEQSDKRLLSLEIFIGLMVSIIFFSLILVASFVQMEDWLRIVLIIVAFIPFTIGIIFAIKIEQTAGYYECKNGIDYAAKVQNESEVVKRWDVYMKDILIMELDPVTGAQPQLKQVFSFK